MNTSQPAEPGLKGEAFLLSTLSLFVQCSLNRSQNRSLHSIFTVCIYEYWIHYPRVEGMNLLSRWNRATHHESVGRRRCLRQRPSKVRRCCANIAPRRLWNGGAISGHFRLCTISPREPWLSQGRMQCKFHHTSSFGQQQTCERSYIWKDLCLLVWKLNTLPANWTFEICIKLLVITLKILSW